MNGTEKHVCAWTFAAYLRFNTFIHAADNTAIMIVRDLMGGSGVGPDLNSQQSSTGSGKWVTGWIQEIYIQGRDIQYQGKHKEKSELFKAGITLMCVTQ